MALESCSATGPSEQKSKELGFDPDALRRKYRDERDKRLRPDGMDQYLAVEGKFAHFAEDDPYADPGFERSAIEETVEVGIIGGGYSGQMAAVRLRELGIKDIRIIEAASDFGGTWYWNRYPGAQCDIESYIYLPLLEETGYIPKLRYSYQPELLEHAKRIGHTFDLYHVALFQTRVRQIRWDADLKRWHIRTNRGDDIKARFVLSAVGVLNRPKLLNIPGIDAFKGHSFHSCRWDYAYTGGDGTGNLDKLADKRVALIGTGASAVGCVPALAASAKHLYVFQRTPSSVDFRNNRPTDPEWARSLGPGWQRARRQNFNAVTSGEPFEEDLVKDGWTDVFRNLRSAGGAGGAGQAEATEIADFKKMNQIRARVDQVVRDPKTAEALKPWYRQFCKRPTMSDDYLEAFNRPNVTLVDTSACHGVQRITEHGVVANGIEYEVDCIIFATGFEFNTPLDRRMEFEILGEGGASLVDHWSKGMRTLHGHSTRGFPNLFFLGISQVGLSANLADMFDGQTRNIAYIIDAAKERGALTVQPTIEGEEAWMTELRRVAVDNREFLESCTPGLYNNEGQFDRSDGGLGTGRYTKGLNAFEAILARWRDKGDLEGLELGR